MKRLQILTLTLTLASLRAQVVDRPVPLSISIAIPAQEAGERELVFDPSSHFHVVIINQADRPIKLWAPDTETSRYALSFEFTSPNATNTVIHPSRQDSISHDLPTPCTLLPHEPFVLNVHCALTNIWPAWPQPKGGAAVLTMRAIYKSPPSPYGDVWTGSITSAPVKVIILK